MVGLVIAALGVEVAEAVLVAVGAVPVAVAVEGRPGSMVGNHEGGWKNARNKVINHADEKV